MFKRSFNIAVKLQRIYTEDYCEMMQTLLLFSIPFMFIVSKFVQIKMSSTHKPIQRRVGLQNSQRQTSYKEFLVDLAYFHFQTL